MDVRISEPEAFPVQVQGPKSKDLMADLFGNEVTSLKYYFFTKTNLDAIPVIVTRTGWTSEVGYEVYLLDATRGDELWERLMEAGRPYDIWPTGPSDIRRIEGGIFNWGADMDSSNNPFEMGLDRLVDLAIDLPFVGKEALRRIESQGVSRKIVGVEIEGERLEMNATKWPVEARGSQVGKVTSAVYSPRLEKNIGYAWVPIELADTGTQLDVETPQGRRGASVVPMPFVDPGKEIPKS
jgi:aminomethyltransferase